MHILFVKEESETILVTRNAYMGAIKRCVLSRLRRFKYCCKPTHRNNGSATI